MRLALTTVAVAAGAWLAAHAALDRVASAAERTVAPYPWDKEEYLHLVTPSSWVEQGEGRVLLCGPSEAREAFRYELFEEAFPDADVQSVAQSWGTLDDFRLMLELVDEAYGEGAAPDAIVIGVTPRWLSGIGLERSPTVYAINEMLPELVVETRDGEPELRPASPVERVGAFATHRTSQGTRYRGAVLGIGREVLRTLGSKLADDPRLQDRLDPYRFDRRSPLGQAHVSRFVEEPRGLHPALQAWDAGADEARVERRFDRVLDLCERLEVALWVVALPVRPGVREFYLPGRLESYRSVLARVLDGERFLDLTDLLDDGEFHDVVHPNRAGAERVSARVIEWMRSEERRS